MRRISFSDSIKQHNEVDEIKNQIKEDFINFFENNDSLTNLQKIEQLYKTYKEKCDKYCIRVDEYFECEIEIQILKGKLKFEYRYNEEEFTKVLQRIKWLKHSFSLAWEDEDCDQEYIINADNEIIGKNIGEIYIVYSEKLLQDKDFDNVIKYTEKILNYKDFYDNKLISTTHRYLANAYFNNGKYTNALKNYTLAIKINPSDIENYFEMAYFFYSYKEFENAKKCYEHIIKNADKLDQKDYLISSYCNLVLVLLSLRRDEKDIEMALEFLTKAEELNTNKDNDIYELIYITRGYIFKEKNIFSDAIEQYDKVLNLNFNQTTANIFKGVCKARNGDMDWENFIKTGISIQLKNAKQASRPPSSLYIYRPINERTISALVGNYLTFSNAKEFNDPMDSRYYMEKTNEYEIKATLDKIKIRSFAKGEENEKGEYVPSNTLMWAHYTKDHEGIAIEYEMKNELKNRLGTDFYFGHIDYSNKLVHNMLLINLDEYAKCFFTKDELWEYEKEYRLITFEDSLENKYKLTNNAILKSITFGFKTSQDNKQTLYRILHNQYPDCKFYEMKIKNIDLEPFKLIREEYKFITDI